MKILLHYPILNTGGAEMSTLRLVRALCDRGHVVTLVVTTGGGALESRVDRRVEFVALRTRARGLEFAAAVGITRKLMALDDLVAYFYHRVSGGFRMLPFRFRRFDLAGTLLQGTPTWFCRVVVRARCRVHWIRSDLTRSDPSGEITAAIRRDNRGIDHYVCVSEFARRALVERVPDVEAKARVIYNILDADAMRRQAEEGGDPFPARSGRLRVLTVCRLHEKSKGLKRMVRVHRRLRDAGMDFDWFLVGDGPDFAATAGAVEEAELVGRFHLLGARANPFPYYRHADICAVLSNYEGLCGAVNEAKVCGRPVLATAFSGVDEQLTDGENGLIVANNEDAIFEGMRRILSDDALRSRLANDKLPQAVRDDAAKLAALEALVEPEPEPVP